MGINRIVVVIGSLRASRTIRRSPTRSSSSVPRTSASTPWIDDLPLYNQDDDGSPSPQSRA